MSKSNLETLDRTVGLDVGDRYIHVCVLDREGDVVEEKRMQTTLKKVRANLESIGRCRVALEVGIHSPWIADLAKELGHQVLVANPRKLRLIYENPTKDDRVDARYLARIARLDPELLSPIEHCGRETRVDREVLRARAKLVETRRNLVNHVRSVVKPVGATIPSCTTDVFHKVAPDHIPDGLWSSIAPILVTIRTLTRNIRSYDKRVEAMCKEKYPETELLRQVPGVGAVTALTFVLTIDDPKRFARSRDVGAYLGLVPRRDHSGRRRPELPITKAGDVALRCLLVQCANYMLGHFGRDTDLRRWGLRYMESGGKNARKRAVVAVARKLAVLLHRLWVTGEVYEPLRGSSDALEPVASGTR